MPTDIRAILSVVAAFIVAAVVYFNSLAGEDFLTWFALALGALMIGAIWLFPETKDRGEGKT